MPTILLQELRPRDRQEPPKTTTRPDQYVVRLIRTHGEVDKDEIADVLETLRDKYDRDPKMRIWIYGGADPEQRILVFYVSTVDGGRILEGALNVATSMTVSVLDCRKDSP